MNYKIKNNNFHQYRAPSAIPFFLFGFFYYLISPYILILMMPNEGLVVSASAFIDSGFFNIYYLADCTIILVSWILGYFFAINFVSHLPKSLDQTATYVLLPTAIFLILFGALLLALSNVFSRGAVLFSGYETYDIKVLGPFATIAFVSLLFMIHFNSFFSKFLFIILFLVSSLVLLGFGSRLFFLMGVISIITWRLAIKGFSIFNLRTLLISSMLAAFIIYIGLWRSNLDISEVGFKQLVVAVFIEPLFTLSSAAVYFDSFGERPSINLPVDILGGIINFIPSFFYPDKLDLINSIVVTQIDYSPFGASSLLLNLYKNFGYLYPIFMFLVGMYYGFIHKCSMSSNFYRSVYMVSLPLLMFYFFREGFITVVKVAFYNAWIFPSIVILFLYFLFSKKSI